MTDGIKRRGERSGSQARSVEAVSSIRWHKAQNIGIKWESDRNPTRTQNVELPIDHYQHRFNNRTLELWHQRDVHQCGPCAIHNLCEALGNTVNLTALGLPQITQTQL